MNQVHKCAKCGKNNVKLYRWYCACLQDDDIFCRRHIPKEYAMFYVPLVEDIDGTVWGYNAVWVNEYSESIKRWRKLPSNSKAGSHFRVQGDIGYIPEYIKKYSKKGLHK